MGLIGQTTTWKLNTKRPRGRPRQRWADRIKEDLKILGERNAEETAKDRKEWRQYTVAKKALKGLWKAQEEEKDIIIAYLIEKYNDSTAKTYRSVI